MDNQQLKILKHDPKMAATKTPDKHSEWGSVAAGFSLRYYLGDCRQSAKPNSLRAV
jgi:hypothetical protein